MVEDMLNKCWGSESEMDTACRRNVSVGSIDLVRECEGRAVYIVSEMVCLRHSGPFVSSAAQPQTGLHELCGPERSRLPECDTIRAFPL